MQMYEINRPPDKIEGVKLTSQNVDEVATWSGGQRVDENGVFAGITLETNLGPRLAIVGWYVLRNAWGEVYTQSADAFESLYTAI